MNPVDLRTDRLVLDQLEDGDVDDVTAYCQDPLFERYLTTPWPYHRHDAQFFIDRVVPEGWEEDREFTWAIRTGAGRPVLGVIGWRRPLAGVGFWLGAPHRGNGYMTEAVAAVADWVFAFDVPVIRWECVVGNLASAAVARAAGFRYTGEAPAEVVGRDGRRPLSWHGELPAGMPRHPKPGWPL